MALRRLARQTSAAPGETEWLLLLAPPCERRPVSVLSREALLRAASLAGSLQSFAVIGAAGAPTPDPLQLAALFGVLYMPASTLVGIVLLYPDGGSARYTTSPASASTRVVSYEYE